MSIAADSIRIERRYAAESRRLRATLQEIEDTIDATVDERETLVRIGRILAAEKRGRR